jgi:hypothetical protein
MRSCQRSADAGAEFCSNWNLELLAAGSFALPNRFRDTDQFDVRQLA